jgi:hypothetical protein
MPLDFSFQSKAKSGSDFMIQNFGFIVKVESKMKKWHARRRGVRPHPQPQPSST